MKNVRVTENIRRGRVVGLGSLTPSEVPAVEWSGSLSCSSYSINFNRLPTCPGKGTFRQTTSIEEWANASPAEEGLEFAIQRKVKDGEIDPETGLVKATYETFALVKGAFATREGFDIQEGRSRVAIPSSSTSTRSSLTVSANRTAAIYQPQV